MSLCVDFMLHLLLSRLQNLAKIQVQGRCTAVKKLFGTRVLFRFLYVMYALSKSHEYIIHVQVSRHFSFHFLKCSRRIRDVVHHLVNELKDFFFCLSLHHCTSSVFDAAALRCFDVILVKLGVLFLFSVWNISSIAHRQRRSRLLKHGKCCGTLQLRTSKPHVRYVTIKSTPHPHSVITRCAAVCAERTIAWLISNTSHFCFQILVSPCKAMCISPTHSLVNHVVFFGCDDWKPSSPISCWFQ